MLLTWTEWRSVLIQVGFSYRLGDRDAIFLLLFNRLVGILRVENERLLRLFLSTLEQSLLVHLESSEMRRSWQKLV